MTAGGVETSPGTARVVLAALLTMSAHSLLLGALPVYLVRGHASPTLVGAVVGGYALSAAVLRAAAGGVIDELRAQDALRLASVLFAAAYLGCAVLPVGWGLVVPRLVQGAAMFLFHAAAQAWIVTHSTAEQRGRRLGLLTSVSGVALVAMPPVGLVLFERIGAEGLFLCCAGAGLLTCALAVSGPLNPEGRVAGPQAQAALGLPFLVVAVLSSTMGALEVSLPRIAEARAVSSLPTVYVFFGVALALGRFAGGWAADRLGRGLLTAAGAALMLAGFALAEYGVGTAFVSMVALTYGLGVGAAGTAMLLEIAERAAAHRRARDLAFAAFAWDVGTAGGAGAAGVLLEWGPSGVSWFGRVASLASLVAAAAVFRARRIVPEGLRA